MVQLGVHDTLAAVHAVVACVATLGTLPAALLIGRYCRSHPHWLRAHMMLNIATTLLIVLAFGLGMGAVASQDAGTQFNGPDSDLHHKAGLGVLAVVLTETALGFVAHGTPVGKRLVEGGGKHWVRWTHVALGLTTAVLGYWLTWEGMYDEWAQMSVAETTTPESVQIIFWIILLFEVSAYTLHAGNEFMRWIEDHLSHIVGRPAEAVVESVPTLERRERRSGCATRLDMATGNLSV
ncbi:hypothetical protein RQP46_008252 [Phenoliferia psychrophenolica]